MSTRSSQGNQPNTRSSVFEMSKKGSLRAWMIEFPLNFQVNYLSTGKFNMVDLSEQTMTFHVSSNEWARREAILCHWIWLRRTDVGRSRIERMSPDNDLEQDRIFFGRCQTAPKVYRLGRLYNEALWSCHLTFSTTEKAAAAAEEEWMFAYTA